MAPPVKNVHVVMQDPPIIQPMTVLGVTVTTLPQTVMLILAFVSTALVILRDLTVIDASLVSMETQYGEFPVSPASVQLLATPSVQLAS